MFAPPKSRRAAHPNRVRPAVERLPDRWLPSGVTPVPEAEPNDTLDLATALGDPLAGGVAAVGAVAAGSADVDWYAFSLAAPAHVILAAADPAGFTGVVGLYNTDPWSFADPDGGAGHRLVARAEGAAALARDLPAGTYYAAVSGAGNRDFHPFLADSGTPGGGANYRLDVTATAPAAGPVLASDPAPNAVLAASPVVIRVALAAPLDPNTVFPGDTVALYASPSPTFDPNTAVPVNLAWVNFSAEATELQVAPLAALGPGFYFLRLVGDTTAGFSVLADPNGVPFGTDAAHPTGQVVTIPFQVGWVEGGTADDTLATAHDLGDLSGGGAARADGAIGDDPFYDPYAPDPLATNPAADVDYYTFRVAGPGRYALTAEVFAGRIGSRLDAGLSLYRFDPADGQLHLVAANANTRNGVATANGMVPLFTDPAVFAGLEAGTYVVAVSSNWNTPDPYLGLTPGADGVFDPNAGHSGTNGGSTGRYVLNVALRPAPTPPAVVSTTLAGGAAPTTFAVQFTRAVNLQRLAYEAYNQPVPGELRAVFVTGPGGATYFPRLAGYDTDTNTARFLMLDRLPAGAFELHLSGANGLTDFADQPLVGTTPGGDDVIPFAVTAAAPGLAVSQTGPTPAGGAALGTLFPNELQTGLVIARDGDAPTAADGYRFTVLQQRTYTFTLDRGGLPADVVLSLFDADGTPEAHATVVPTGDAIQAFLDPGTYEIRVGGWAAGGVAYRLALQLGDSGDNPPPLTVGPRPAAATNLVTIRGLTPTPAGDGTAPAPPTPAPTPAPPAPVPPTPLPAPTAFAGLPAAPTGPAVARLTPDGLTTPVAQPPAFPPTAPAATVEAVSDAVGAEMAHAADAACTPPPAPPAAPAAATFLSVGDPPVEVAPPPAEAAPPAAAASEGTPVPPAVLASLQSGPLGGTAPDTPRGPFTFVAPPPRAVEAAAEEPAVVTTAAPAAEPAPAEAATGWWVVAAAAAGAGLGVAAQRACAAPRRPGFDCGRDGAPDRITL